MPRPKKEPGEHRAHPRQVKFTDRENDAYLALVKSFASSGPSPRDAHLLLWLVEQECRRRGIPWPSQ